MHEGFYPFRDKKVARKEKEEAPGSFTVSYEELLVPGELEKFHLTEKEEKEIIEKHFGKAKKRRRKGKRRRGTQETATITNMMKICMCKNSATEKRERRK